jgi:hypothetical protein
LECRVLPSDSGESSFRNRKAHQSEVSRPSGYRC